MSKKIYVGNLPSSVTDKHLFDLFSKIGTVISAKVTMGIDGKKNAGYGYVTMNSDLETQNSIQQLNGTKVEGAHIKVLEAHPIDQDSSYMFKRSRVRRR